ncbi:MAG: preprotein translocase subunit SecG [Clostridium butyricum]|nr:preprotein translocase subunit SecG [Clostridium butyricum]
MENILLIVEVILGLGILITIFMQPSKADALSGLIQGGNKETFFAKNKSRTKEVLLVRLTTFFSILFAINTLILNII